jgi:hypothetical protein
MSYHALNDTVQDRNRRKEQQDEEGQVADMHASIAAKMNEVAADNSPRAQLFDAQLAKGQEQAAVCKDVSEVKAAKHDRLKPRWQRAVDHAREVFNEDPRMIGKDKPDAIPDAPSE